MKAKLCCFLVGLMALSVSGCGLKGPLYMPEQKAQAESPKAQTPQAAQTQSE